MLKFEMLVVGADRSIMGQAGKVTAPPRTIEGSVVFAKVARVAKVIGLFRTVNVRFGLRATLLQGPSTRDMGIFCRKSPSATDVFSVVRATNRGTCALIGSVSPSI